MMPKYNEYINQNGIKRQWVTLVPCWVKIHRPVALFMKYSKIRTSVIEIKIHQRTRFRLSYIIYWEDNTSRSCALGILATVLSHREWTAVYGPLYIEEKCEVGQVSKPLWVSHMISFITIIMMIVVVTMIMKMTMIMIIHVIIMIIIIRW